MYSSSKASIFKDNMVSDSFPTTVGVKQGDVLSTLPFNTYIDDLPDALKKATNEVGLSLFNSPINSLLYADNLVLLGLNREELQTKLDKLNQYCLNWGLKVNIKKTKIMIFNKAGATIKKHKFNFQGNILDSVNQYTYLGFVFIPSGKMHTGIEHLINKAKKAWFSIQKSLMKSKEKTVHTYTKLIDSVIKPVLLYACEVWGDLPSKKLYENKVERFHLSMCKQVLGINKRANNVSTLSELGRYPLYKDIETQIFKYFQRFIHIEKDRFSYKAFQEQCSLDIMNKTGWVVSIKKS